MTPSFLRQSSWVSPSSFAVPIHIVGCGAVGSNLALQLAKMGAQEFVLYDFDDVEPHNLPNQAYFAKHVGMPKVEALKDVLQSFNPQVQVKVYKEKFTEAHAQEVSNGIVCLAVDSLRARGEIADLVRLHAEAPVMTDCRMGFEYAEFYMFRPLDGSSYQQWRQTVAPDEQAVESPCNRQICATVVGLVTSYCAHQICNFVIDPAFKIKARRAFQLDTDLHTV